MPHKRNPVRCERVTGLARVIRGNLQAALENTVLWHERDISHSSAERVILPDSTIALHFMLAEMTEVLDGLVIYPERMRENLQVGGGLAFSQNVLLALVDAGLPRDEAYAIVQDAAATAWDEGASFRELVAADPRVRERIGDRLDELFDPVGRAAEPRRRVRPAREGRGPRGMSGTAARLHGQGKVRDIYDVGDDRVLLVATDRISAFDVVLPEPDPGQGPRPDRAHAVLARTHDRRRPQPPRERRPARLPRAVPQRAGAGRPGDARHQGAGDPRRVRGARLPHGFGAEAVPGRGSRLRRRAAGGAGRVVEAARADLHARRRRPPRATTCRSRSTRRSTWSAAGSPNACARSRSRCTSGAPRSPPSAGSCSPTRSSSSGSRAAS